MVELKYYWIVTYDDNTKHSQFNPDGTENLWKEVDQSRVIRVSWCQFSRKLSNKVEISTKWALFPRKYSLNYDINDEIVICRRNHIIFSESRGEKGRKTEYILGKNKEEIIKL